MANNNAKDHPGVHYGTPQPPNFETTIGRVPANLGNTADNLDQSHEVYSFSEPSFTSLPSQADRRLWDSFAFLNNDDGTLQDDRNTLLAEPAFGDQAPLHAQHYQRQNQTFGGPIDNIQLVPLDAPWNWPDSLSNNAFFSVFKDDRQLLNSQPESIMEGFVIPSPPRGVPTVDQLESVDAAALGPQYQEPNYEEFFHGLDLFEDAELFGTFDPSLSHQASFPLAEPSEPMNILPEFHEAFRNEIHDTIANVQGFSTPPNLFLQNPLNDVLDGASNQWIFPQLPQNGIEGPAQITKRPSSHDDPQPSKRPRHHKNVTNIHQNPSLDQLAHPTPESFSQAAKRPHPDVDLPPDKYARTKKSMTSAHASSDHDPLSQAFSKALAEIPAPNSPRRQSRLLLPRNLTQAGGSGSFQVFQLKALKPASPEIKSNAARAPAQSPENVCLQCKVRKKQCVPTNGLSQSQSACKKCLALANGDEGVAKTLCIRPKDLELKLVNPDVYFDSYLAIARQISAPLSSTVQRRVAIHMTFLIKENPHLPALWKSTALICNVEEHKVKGSDGVAIDMLHYQTFNDLRYMQVGGLHSRRMPSIGIPEGQVPRLPNLIRWATSTLALSPNGAVFGLQGPIYQFASLYIEKEHRLLRGLVELALRYTAIYNVCVGQMSVQLSPASPVLYKIPPKLRVQICGPLLRHYVKLGEQLQKSILKALYSRHGPEKEELVPLCTVWWLLMTVYRHNLNDSAMAALICYAAEKIDVNYLEIREEMLSNLARTHQAIYHALFRRDPKFPCPIFNNALVKLCGIEKEDIDLLEKLQSLRTAMRQFKEDATARGDKGKVQDKLEDLTNLFGAIELDKHQPSVAVPDDAVDANKLEEVDEAQSISSTCSESSRLLDREGDKSQAEVKATAAEVSKLREYWLARWILEYDNQAWLFGY